MTTLELVPDPPYSRVRVIVTGATGGHLYRDDGNGPVIVRNGYTITGEAALDDYEAPVDVPVTYYLDDATETVTLPGTSGPFLIHPTDPLRNMAVTVVEDDPVTVTAPGTVHQVLAAPLPLVTYTARNLYETELSLWVEWERRHALETLLSDGSPVLLKAPAGCAFDGGWYWVESYRRRNTDRRATRGMRVEARTVRVETPGGYISADPTNSYAAIVAFHTDYADVAAAHPSYLDLLQTPHPHPI